jgi:hypothetical protein
VNFHCVNLLFLLVCSGNYTVYKFNYFSLNVLKCLIYIISACFLDYSLNLNSIKQNTKKAHGVELYLRLTNTLNTKKIRIHLAFLKKDNYEHYQTNH